MTSFTNELETAQEAASLAGRRIRELREQHDFSVRKKKDTTLVTSADLEAEKIITDIISQRFPDHRILSEESFPAESNAEFYHAPLWIIDPIDGTTNFAHDHMHVSVSIAFAINGVVQTGVVECPFLSETFHAIRGGGAYLNDRKFKCSTTSELEDALVCTGFPYDRSNLDELLAWVKAVLENCRDLRRIGSGAIDICWVGCGRLDGFYETLAPWDIAAASLIAREAGATIDHIRLPQSSGHIPDDLNSFEFVVAGAALLPQLVQLLRQAVI